MSQTELNENTQIKERRDGPSSFSLWLKLRALGDDCLLKAETYFVSSRTHPESWCVLRWPPRKKTDAWSTRVWGFYCFIRVNSWEITGGKKGEGWGMKCSKKVYGLIYFALYVKHFKHFKYRRHQRTLLCHILMLWSHFTQLIWQFSLLKCT